MRFAAAIAQIVVLVACSDFIVNGHYNKKKILIARDDFFYVSSEGPTYLDVLKNDVSSQHQSLHVVSIFYEGNAFLEVKENKVIYTPKNLGYTGEINFKYIVVDGISCDIGKVVLRVTNNNI